MTTTHRSSDSRPVILALRRPLHAAFTDVLTDWSVLGLVGPVHLIDLDSMTVADPLVPSVLLVDGRREPGSLQSQLASGGVTNGARLVIVEGSADDQQVDRDLATHVQREISRSLSATELVPVRLRLTTADKRLALPEGWLGWRNQVLAPEILQAPGLGITPLVGDESSPTERLHAVAAVASLAGLWRGQGQAPVDVLRGDPGKTWTAARTFSRHLGAEVIDDELMQRLCDVAEGYPLPQLGETSAQRVADEQAAAAHMAGQLIAKHSSLLLPTERAQMPPSSTTKVSFLDAMRMLFAFLGQAIRNAPSAFVDKVVHTASSTLAGVGTRVVFGRGDSDFEVVVRGVRADGTMASLQQLDEANDAAAAKVGASSAQAGGASMAPVWRDYCVAGMTLLDAGTRQPDLAGPTMGGKPGVVGDPTVVTPRLDDEFEMPAEISTYLSYESVDPHDVLLQNGVQNELAEVGTKEKHLRGKTAQVSERLRAWRVSVDTSFTGRIGSTIAQGIVASRQDVANFAEELREAQSVAEIPDDIGAQQKQLARRLWVVLGVAVLLAAVTVVLLAFGLIGVLTGVTIGLVILLLWTITSTVIFLRGQRDLFTLLHRRRDLMSRSELLRENLVDAVADLRRLTRAYIEYLAWTKAYSVFLHRPLGFPEPSLSQEQGLGRGFPLNHDFGSGEPDEDSIAEVTVRLQRSIFTVGWLSGTWERFLKQVPTSMGADAYLVRDNPAVLYDDPGSGGDGLLRRWSKARVEQPRWGVESDALHDTVQKAVHDLGLTRTLLSRVLSRDPASGQPRPLTFDEFFGGLDEETLQTVQSTFDQHMFGPEARAREVWRVEQNVVHSTERGLGRTVSVAQFSGGFAGYEVASSESERDVDVWGDVDAGSDSDAPLI